MGDNSEYLGEGCIDLGMCRLKHAAVLSPSVPSFVFACQAGGSGISNKSLTGQRRRARPAAIAGVLER